MAHSYIALEGKRKFEGSWFSCLHWSELRANKHKHSVIKIVRIRAENFTKRIQGRIVAEVTHEGVRIIKNGRQIKI